MSAVTTEVARDLEALPEVMRVLETFLSTTTADPKARFAVELALEEIFINMVKHNSNGEGRIRIDLDLSEAELTVKVTDFDAPPFDPVADAPQVDINLPLEDRTEGGLGIHLVKKMMDGIEYSHKNRTGTITLHKRMN